MRDQGTDILLLQEVQRRQTRLIARALGAQSRHWGLKHWPVRVWAEGMAVLGLTMPVSVRSYAVTKRLSFWSWRRRLIQIGRAGDVTVLNVHLTPHGQPAEDDRAREVAWLLRRTTGTDPLIAGGDFNDTPAAAIFDRLTDAGLRDAWVAAHPDDSSGGFTNWGKNRDRAPRRRLDYLWVSAAVTVDAMVVPVYGSEGFGRFPKLSDHLPVTGALRIGPTGDG